MCPDRLSLSFQLMKSALPEAERAVPGMGCELLTGMAAIADAAIVVGLVTGLALAWVIYDVASRGQVSRRYRELKAACDGS